MDQRRELFLDNDLVPEFVPAKESERTERVSGHIWDQARSAHVWGKESCNGEFQGKERSVERYITK